METKITKAEYEVPEMEIVLLGKEDIIVTSVGNGDMGPEMGG